MHLWMYLFLFLYGVSAVPTFNDDDLITYVTVSSCPATRHPVPTLTLDLL